MSGRYVDFKEVKARVNLEDVLTHYGLLETLKRKGDALIGPCPIHQGKSKTTFKASLSRNIWNCFGPCSGGNVLDFVAQMEQVDIREAALLLADWFHLHSSKAPRHPRDDETPQGRVREVEAGKAQPPEALEPNKPLTFILKNVDPDHTFVQRLGFKPETVRHFGAGYCSKGIMRGRVAIPIHNAAGELVAYAGRATRRGEDLYKYPPTFHRGLEVYNLHRAECSERPIEAGLIVTLGFLGVWRLYEAGFDNAVALMDAALSGEQVRLLRKSARARARITVVVKHKVPAPLLSRLCQAFYVHLVEMQSWPAEIGEEELYGAA